MLIFKCDRCGTEHRSTKMPSELIEPISEEAWLPEGWFEYEGKLYCGGHYKKPLTGYEIIDLRSQAPSSL